MLEKVDTLRNLLGGLVLFGVGCAFLTTGDTGVFRSLAS